MSLRGHEGILAAITARDGDATPRASLSHITEVRDGTLRAPNASSSTG